MKLYISRKFPLETRTTNHNLDAISAFRGIPARSARLNRDLCASPMNAEPITKTGLEATHKSNKLAARGGIRRVTKSMGKAVRSLRALQPTNEISETVSDLKRLWNEPRSSNRQGCPGD